MSVDLNALIERIEAAEGFDGALQEAILTAFGWRWDGSMLISPTGHPERRAPAILESIDAAMTLVPEGYSWAVGDCGEEGRPWACVTSPLDDDEDGGCKDYTSNASTPALALCAAALRARSAA